ncbi:MAG: DUF1553 domain-containing protein [Opitutales bacterium]|nr:DUF1553 domain-containing protein [Opitutales bacterium]MBT5168753.1 DUF1553 domain-containing protein [Opitutales bacterium]MBT5816126.1 DUF1553 domain-containing protein [Opitutales bacterium]MBT6381566.1 DUF1553 domain-containing protein [Opitutales bacterium]
MHRYLNAPFSFYPLMRSVGAVVFSSWIAFSVIGESIDFNRDIRPILSDKCFKCHGPDEAYREADLRLDTLEGVLADLGDGYFPAVAGKPEDSEIVWRIEADDEEDLMPPPDSDMALSDMEKQRLRQWIAEGVEWKQHWSFEAVERPETPSVSKPKWVRNGIDSFVLSRLDEAGLSPSKEADRTTLIRRLTLDLTGLPPTPDEVGDFLADESASAYERLVNRLLDSPRYGEAMALPWLEASRYADTDGYQNDGPRSMWRWRDWVIDAYNRNLSFDQFTIEQLAGDLLDEPTFDQVLATGFNRNHRYNSESGLVLEEFLLENAVDRVDTTSTVWMGLTMGCARCHDHKYDPISTKEYYQLISIFDNVPESGRAVKFGNSEPWITSPTREQAEKLAAWDGELKVARTKRESFRSEIDAAIASWEGQGKLSLDESSVVGRGLVERFSLFGNDIVAEIDGKVPVFKKGIRGQAASFDGESVLGLESESGFLCHERFSLAFWLKPKDLSEGVILSKQGENSLRAGLSVEVKDGHLQFYIITRWVAGVGAIETVEPISVDRWQHVTLTNDGSQSATGMRIFVDGEAVETRITYNTNSNVVARAKGATLRIGKGVVGEGFKGEVDEVRVYDRTLWEDEVAILAESESLVAIGKKEVSDRSGSEAAKWRAYYLEYEAGESLKQLDQSVFAAKMKRQEFHDSLPTTMVMQEMDPPRATRIRERGVYHQYGDVVEDRLPDVFPDYPEGAPRNRLGFAQWLVSGDHPLTSRVAVNRYWLKYFGRGLVKTAEDFGVQGDWPSHPRLLDWLADEFVSIGWDVKAMQKLIVTSATYRQESRVTPELLEADPENVLLARGPRQRLSAHALRDQALATSGLLVERIGGESVSPYQPDKLWELMSNMKYKQSSGEDLYRRSLYTIWKRTIPPPSMALMDAADRESCIVSSKRTNTPLQALTLLNEKTFVEAARNLGQRLLQEGGDTMGEQVEFGFRTTLARTPSERESALLESAYREYRDAYEEDLVGAEQLIGVGESEAIASLDPRDLAAATALSNVLLNLDEAMTKE